VKLTARIAATSRRPGARDDVGAAALPATAGDSKGSGAPARLALRPVAAGAMAIALLLASFAGTASAAEPVFTVNAPTPGYTTAELSGSVNAEDISAYYFFEYAHDPAAEGWTPGPEQFSRFAEPNTGVHAFTETITGLKPDTSYKVRIVAYNGETFEPVFSPEPYATFTTKHIDPPTVTLDPVTTFTADSAHFSGTVNANAPAGALAPDQEAAYETNWHIVCEPECVGAPSGVIKPGEAGFRASEGAVPVAFDATHLESNTTYEVKLVATSANGSKETVAERTFSTLLVAPTVRSAAGASDGQSGYVVEGIVNPLGSTISDCHFEYGPTANYVFQAPCSPTPVGRSEVQELSYDNASEGQFRLVFKGQETGDIDYGASAATVEAALKGLSTIGPDGVVEVTAPEPPGEPLTGGPYTVTFGGPMAELNIPQISFRTGTDPLRRNVGLGGGSGSVVTTTRTQGGNSLPIVVEAHLTGLTPGATYHVQLVATNGGGTSKSGDQIFVPTQEPPQPPCPNEAVRRENNSLALPECRAYEQVTPVSKGGYRALFYGFFEGKSVIYQSSAANIANSGQSRGLANFYVANRTASGWETIPNLNPAGSINAGPEALGLAGRNEPLLYSEDLQISDWFVGPGATFATENEPYRKGTDGRFTQIGTLLHPMSQNDSPVIGASADLSHLLLAGGGEQGALFGPGLYEFVGTGNGAPNRVDLDNSDQPVSECVSGGFGGLQGAIGNAMSRDGRTIFFTAIGGCGAAGPPADEVWARVNGTTSYDASESHCTRVDCNAPAPAHFAGAASDGSSVFFTTTQQLVNGDTDEAEDLYVYHLPTASEPNPSPVLTEVSGMGTGANTEEGVSVSVNGSTAEGVTVSADGSTAMFVSPAVLAGNEDAMEETAKQGDHNLYVWRRDASHPEGQVTFVGRLINNDLIQAKNVESPSKPETTPDGRYVVFSTASKLVPTDTDEGFDVYRYSTQSGELTRVSTGPLGTGGNADGFNAGLPSRAVDGSTRDPWPSQLSISETGQSIVFATTEGLVPRDGNGATDIYLWKNGRVSLISSGAAGNNVNESEFAIDPSGQDIYFITGEALSPSDGDSVNDVYDARVGGGFSVTEATTGCSGEACQPAGPGAPSSPSPATNQTRAAESPTTTPTTCPKGKVLKKGKCTKKPQKHKKHHKKHKGKRGAKKHGGAK
jgi:hypothetical protein